MAIGYRASVPAWLLNDKTGKPLIGGKMYSYEASDHGLMKPIYKDSACTQPYDNPMTADSSGSFPDTNVGKELYFESSSQYYLRIYDALGNFIRDTDAFPDEKNQQELEQSDIKNIFCNSDFKYRNLNKYFTDDLPGGTDVTVADGNWLFKRNNSNSDITLEFNDFLPGQVNVPNNPISYVTYRCSSIGAGGETYKHFVMRFFNVNTLAGQICSFRLYARSDYNSAIQFKIIQNFGSGGSPEVNIFYGKQLTNTWSENLLENITIPSIAGKIAGSGSYLEIGIQFPLNQIAHVDFTLISGNKGDEIFAYDYKNYEQESAIIKTNTLPLIPRSKYDVSNPLCNPDATIWHGDVLSWNAYNEAIEYMPPVPPGSWVGWFSELAAPTGWVSLANGPGYLRRWLHRRLYAYFGLKYGFNTYNNNFTVISQVGNKITVQSAGVGVMAHFADVDTGFTFNTIQVGSPTLAEKVEITCTNASGFQGGEVFTFGSPSGQLSYIYISVNGSGIDPNLPGYTNRCWLNVDNANSDVDVATKLADLLNVWVFCLPKYALGTFLRIINAGSGNDPDATIRTARPDGVTGDNLGTIQNSQNLAHIHGVTDPGHYHSYTNQDKPGGTQGTTSGSNLAADITGTSVTGISINSEGGLEARPKNVYTDILIKY